MNAVNSNQYDEIYDDEVFRFANTMIFPSTKFLATKFPPPKIKQLKFSEFCKSNFNIFLPLNILFLYRFGVLTQGKDRWAFFVLIFQFVATDYCPRFTKDLSERPDAKFVCETVCGYWSEQFQKCYKLSKSTNMYEEAKRKCENSYFKLGYPNTKSEAELMSHVFKQHFKIMPRTVKVRILFLAFF